MKKQPELLKGRVYVHKGGEKVEFSSLSKEEQVKVFADADRRYAEQWAARNGLEVESIEPIQNTETA